MYEIIRDHGVEVGEPLASRARAELVQFIKAGPPTNQRNVRVQFFRTTPRRTVVVPSAWFRRHVPVDTTFRPPKQISGTFTGVLRDNQTSVVDEAVSMLSTKFSACLVLPTGFGKTVVAIDLICRLGLKTVVLVHKSFLQSQWRERLGQYTTGLAVSFVGGGSVDWSGDVVIGLLQTVVKTGVPADVGVVIVDEAHHIAAAVFSGVLLRCAPRYVIGLSATPIRKDGLDVRPLVGDFVERTDDRSFDVNVEVHRFSSKTPAPGADVHHSLLVNWIVDDADRLRFVVDLTKRASTRHETLVLSHRRAHVTALTRALVGAGVDAAALTPASGPVTTQVVVSTYQFVAEGFDDDRLSCVVLATPSPDVVQAVGRILSKGGKKLVVDVLDVGSGICFTQLAKRKRFFASRGWQVITRSTARPAFVPDA